MLRLLTEVAKDRTLEKYAPIVALMENPEQIVKTICEYEMHNDRDRGGWAWQALRKELGYPDSISHSIMDLSFSDIKERNDD